MEDRSATCLLLAPLADTAYGSRRALPGYAVLCLEPDAAGRDFLSRSLAAYNPVVAAQPEDALARLASTAFDAYVLGGRLASPHLELCRRIRALDSAAPIVFWTTAAPGQQRLPQNIGASTCLRKPADDARIAAEVAAWLERCAAGNNRALDAARRALGAEVSARRAALPVEDTSELVQRAFQRSAYGKARQAYTSAGGTLAQFDRCWPQLWADATRLLDGSAS